MARKPRDTQTAVDAPVLNEEKFAKLDSDASELVVLRQQHDAAAREVALAVGYDLPADCTDPDLIQRDISANMRRSVEACLEVGRGLAVLKAACGHGNFTDRLDTLGIEERVAQKFMSSARRFSKAATSPVLKALDGQSKLFEMLVLDDEQLEELATNGKTGELELDDVATMSVKQLRGALREVRADIDAKDQLLGEKNKRIDQLKAQQKRIERLQPDQVLVELQKESAEIMSGVLGGLRGQLRQALIALKNHGDEDHTQYMAGLVGQVQADLIALRDEFNLPETVGDGTPDWQKFVPGSNAETAGPVTHGRALAS